VAFRKTVPGEFVRFVVIGVLNTVAMYSFYLLLILLIPYVFAYAVTFVTGTLISASLNARLSFKARLTGRTLFRFTLVYTASFLLSVWFLVFIVEDLGIHYQIAPIIVLAVFTPLNFLSAKFALTGWLAQNSQISDKTK
jgi:putative flippase GtrA